MKKDTLSDAPDIYPEILRLLAKFGHVKTPKVHLSDNVPVDQCLLMSELLFKDSTPRIILHTSWHRQIKRKTDLYIELTAPAPYTPKLVLDLQGLKDPRNEAPWSFFW